MPPAGPYAPEHKSTQNNTNTNSNHTTVQIQFIMHIRIPAMQVQFSTEELALTLFEYDGQGWARAADVFAGHQ